MAKIMFVSKRNPRRKKWEHLKIKCRQYILRLSVLMNIIMIGFYLQEKYNWLTNIIERVSPILESLITHLPLH